MAFVVKRGPFSFQVRYKENGKSIVDATFDTEPEALKRVAEIALDKSVGRKIDRKMGIIKVIDALNLYESTEVCKKAGYLGNGIYRYRMWKNKDNKYHLKFLNENLSNVTASYVKAWVDNRLKGVSASTLNRDLNELSAFFSWCKYHYDLEWFNNPVAGVKRPSSNDERDRIVERNSDEEQRLIEAIKASETHILYPAFILAIQTGARRKELCNVTFDQVFDLDSDAPYITLYASQTKTVKRRSLPLSEESVKAIKLLKPAHDKLKAEDDRRLAEGKKITVKHDYRKLLAGITPSGLSQAFSKAREKAGITDLRLHDLRHCATTRLFEDGFGITEVCSVTGHFSLASLRRYTNHSAQNIAKKMRLKK